MKRTWTIVGVANVAASLTWYQSALNRARTLVPQFEDEPHVNPSTATREFSVRDLDGYYVTISEA
jgi:hypothetical protein